MPIRWTTAWNKVQRWGSRIWLALVAVFIGIAAYSQPVSWHELYGWFDFRLLFISLLLILFGKGLTICLVQQSLLAFDQRCSFQYAWYAYSIGDISKYLPGGVWGIAGRLAVYKSSGIPLKLASKILVFETGVLVLVSFLTGVVLIGVNGRVYLTCGALLVLSCLIYALTIFVPISIGRSASMIGLQIVSWSIFGASFAVLGSQTTEVAFHLAGIFNIGFAAGTVVVFAPSGIGIRESVIGFFGGGDVRHLVEVSVLHRLVWLVCDVIVFMPSTRKMNTWRSGYFG